MMMMIMMMMMMMTNLSFRLNFLISGPSPLGFHLTNVLLHGLVSLLLMRLATSLPGLTNRTEDCTLETIGKPVFKR